MDAEELARELASSLLSSEYGVDEASYSLLMGLLGRLVGAEETEALDSIVDYTDGYYYIPNGNLIDTDPADDVDEPWSDLAD